MQLFFSFLFFLFLVFSSLYCSAVSLSTVTVRSLSPFDCLTSALKGALSPMNLSGSDGLEEHGYCELVSPKQHLDASCPAAGASMMVSQLRTSYSSPRYVTPKQHLDASCPAAGESMMPRQLRICNFSPRSFMGNIYMSMLELHGAYLGALTCYGRPTFGSNIAYPGCPLAHNVLQQALPLMTEGYEYRSIQMPGCPVVQKVYEVTKFLGDTNQQKSISYGSMQSFIVFLLPSSSHRGDSKLTGYFSDWGAVGDFIEKSTGTPSLYSAASVSLSRTGTTYPQAISRVPSPCLTPIGRERVSSNDQRNQNPVNGVTSAVNECPATYPGCPLACHPLEHIHVAPCRPIRHPWETMNYSGGVMGSWRMDCSLDEGFGSSCLEEFESNKTGGFEFSQIAGHVVEFSLDQYEEITPQALALMNEGYGSYVIPKVYGVTKLLGDHHGGDEVVLTCTGKDATDDWEDVGHSSTAKAMLDEYYVGDIDTATVPVKAKFAFVPPTWKKSEANQDKNSDFVIELLQLDCSSPNLLRLGF